MWCKRKMHTVSVHTHELSMWWKQVQCWHCGRFEPNPTTQFKLTFLIWTVEDPNPVPKCPWGASGPPWFVKVVYILGAIYTLQVFHLREKIVLSKFHQIYLTFTRSTLGRKMKSTKNSVKGKNIKLKSKDMAEKLLHLWRHSPKIHDPQPKKFF